MSQFFTSGAKVLEAFSISPSDEYLQLISFRIDWFDLLAGQGTVKSLLQYHSGSTPGLGRSSGEEDSYPFLGRKSMTNLDSILKSRDITLSTKVHLVKAMVLPVVMHRCETWTMKKAQC